MSFETKVHDVLMNFPIVKKVIKRVYQVLNVAVFRPKKTDGNISRISPDDGYEYFFGYYDKSPWDTDDRYMLALRVKNAHKNFAPKESAEVVMFDVKNRNEMKIIGKTRTWNVQQGAMLSWLGPDFKEKIIYNDFRNKKFCSVILNVKTGEERVIGMPVYSVSSDGKTALSLDFSRLNTLRPGYGYSNLKDKTKDVKIPNGACVFKINLEMDEIEPLLTYKQLFNFEHRDGMDEAFHKVNHLMVSPNGERFMVIHRWLRGGKKFSRLITCDMDGKNLYNLADEGMVSHCYWKNDKEILGYCKRGGKNGYFLMKDKTQEFERKWEFLGADGHPSYSPNGELVLTDTYPNRKRISTLRVLSDNVSFAVGKVYSPFKYDNDVRCDLHPRWSRDGEKICFDGCFEGRRGLYTIDLSKNIVEKKKDDGQKFGKIKIIYLMTSCRKAGPTEQTLNMIKNLDREKFDPILVTIYEEGVDSRINDFLPYVSAHYTLLASKKAIMMGKNGLMQDFLKEQKPDLIHSVGVFPNYLIAEIGFKNHVFTLRNFVYEDFSAKFGKIKGNILAKMQIKAIKETKNVITCSKSLQKIYQEKLNIKTKCIQNGIDIEKYQPINKKERNARRKRLGFPENDFIFIYSGQFIERKNIPFMIEGFLKARSENDKLILLGDGDLLVGIKEKYKDKESLIFMGSVDNVSEYLSIADVYISASRSEGLPNGVMEAMAMGVPVLLSDIPQHKELLENDGGVTFKLDDGDDYVQKIKYISKLDMDKISVNVRKNMEENFSGAKMSIEYQKEYALMTCEGDAELIRRTK